MDANGNRTVNPTTTTTYVCVAVSGTLQASATLTVPVSTAPIVTTGPVIVVSSTGATCTTSFVVNGTVVCETVIRTLVLDLSGSMAPAGSGPLTFNITSRNTQAVILNPTSSLPTVQVDDLIGDYFFDVTATDAKGNSTTQAVDVRLVVNTHRL